MSNSYRIAWAVLVGVLAAGGGLAVVRPARAVPIRPTVIIQSHTGGLCVAALGTNSGAPAVQTRCDVSSKALLWVRFYICGG